MFTLTQIQQAHSQVKSGADFPAYIQALRSLGVSYYETFVGDGHTDYWSTNGYQTSSPAKYEPLPIAEASNPDQFQADLKAHQQGKTDYPTFCADCAQSGIEKWVVNLDQFTCTYYNTAGSAVWLESIST
jgi:uncharacterized protein YbcV (DUF1398 family)